ncbi:hypothetical protein AWENTII_002124 [Aspergillus wentii]|nr:hypothetical protein MW887_004680 [Aspergillus wentii]
MTSYPSGTIFLSLVSILLLAFTAEAAPLQDVSTRRTLQGRNGAPNATTWKPTPFASSSSVSKSPHVMSLKKLNTTGTNHRSAAYVKGLASKTSASGTLVPLFEREEYAASITFESQSFDVIVDTRSSDTWVVKSGFDCVDLDPGNETSTTDCNFGSTFTVDRTVREISEEKFQIEYGYGEYLYGYMATETVTLADITVNQEVAVVTKAAWNGGGTTSGLTGLAYPALTSAYSGNGKQKAYDPIFTTMYKDGLVDSYFSLAILRDMSGDAGYLTLGGLPPIHFDETFTSTPILVTSIEGYSKSYDFYTINIDSMTLNGESVSGSGGSDIQYIVDSGTTLNYYPTSVADAVNKAFSPVATTYNEDERAYIVECDATPPAKGIV